MHRRARMMRPLGYRPVLLAALLCTAAAFAACGSGSGGGSADALPGRTLFVEKNCVICHGQNAEGYTNGPPLRNLKRFYTREQVIEYLKDPQAYAATDPRLSARQSEYPGLMPKFGYLEPLQLEQLADYVLALQ